MAASDHLSNVLFAQHYHRLHQMTVAQAAAGYGRITSGGALMTPEEHGAAVDELEAWLSRKGARSPRQPWSEVHAEMMSNPDPVDTQLRSWARNHREFLVGNPYRVASNIIHLTGEMRSAGVPNMRRLYRGSQEAPHVEAARGAPLSFTEDVNVARSFVAINSTPAKRARIFKVAADTVRGLRLEDYGVAIRTVGRGRRMEKEMLVDPQSIKESS